MLIFMFLIQHILNRMKLVIPMIYGLAFYIMSMLILILSPVKSMVLIILYTLAEAIAHALFMPRREAMLTLNVDPNERARIVSLLTSITILFSSPFGYIAGILSGIDARLPFIFNILLYLVAVLVLLFFNKYTDDSNPEPAI